MKRNPSCASATHIPAQRATFSSKGASTPATVAQPNSLKALVARRFPRNTQRNTDATSPDSTRNSTATATATRATRNAPVVGVEIEDGGLVDIWNRKQCLSCESWKFQRCNSPEKTTRDNWNGVIHFLPNPELWWRCEFHSFNDK